MKKTAPDFLFTDKKDGAVFGLCANLHMASRVAQSAKVCRLSAHNFDRAEALLTHLRQTKPVLIVMDLDSCEAEAFKVLKELRQNAEFKGVATIGAVSSGANNPVKEEAQRAGCHRAYTKTEFLKDLDLILARYVS